MEYKTLDNLSYTESRKKYKHVHPVSMATSFAATILLLPKRQPVLPLVGPQGQKLILAPSVVGGSSTLVAPTQPTVGALSPVGPQNHKTVPAPLVVGGTSVVVAPTQPASGATDSQSLGPLFPIPQLEQRHAPPASLARKGPLRHHPSIVPAADKGNPNQWQVVNCNAARRASRSSSVPEACGKPSQSVKPKDQ